MANYWAITIGINQYQLFQPLRCAQADAEVLNNFLVQEGGLAQQRCLLMTASSPPIGDRSTYPTKQNILLLLEHLTAGCWQPQDHLWLFFSGYGVSYKGKDYLMPVEGNPQLVEETGIEVRSLMQNLQLAEINTLLLLDINRAFGTQADSPVGPETIEIAKKLQIAAILSCQSEEFSHESSELGHGFFTAALLEALRSGNASNLTDLDSYLSVLTPELCQHYWRPTQNPVTIFPAKPQAILPQLEVPSYKELVPSTIEPEPSGVGAVIFPDETFAVALTAPSLGATTPNNFTQKQNASIWAAAQGVETTLGGKSPSVNFSNFIPAIGQLEEQQLSGLAKKQYLNQQNPLNKQMATGGRFIPNAPQPDASRRSENQVDTSLWKQFLFWGGGTMLVVALISVVILRNQAMLLQGKGISRPSPITATPELTPSTPSETSPITPPAKNQSSAQIASNSESKKRSQAVLDLAKMSLRETQASDLSKAIATASKIQPDQPLYEQAQDNIKIWSRMILDLAEGRAKQKEYTNAIAAAQLVSSDQPLYLQAQAAISQWQLEAQQYVGNQTVLDAAQSLIIPGQASTYNRAIEVARRVPPGQPGFDSAEKSINEWSEKILELAKNRADQGNITAAIETATLVPEVTAVYEDAQEAIQKWQSRKIVN
ncbi:MULTISPECIES: caspase family protein [unclassified Nodularia (in: cyanobacteria)]|uniref:caspase family protein n=1 Tax=unclassified Nodularia (in: cyanobacteria) TaxID=2656917 RepID=UPI00187F034D|nr:MULTISPECIES: caspase family protein [unclassified Nodularia (in: cyanobacteria)]MBE9200871.1 caspase family protein [Nodularia sp. LEGE 06071]MCC2692361.1 caspase family protein [Nodularia sp. LEGE 04288]